MKKQFIIIIILLIPVLLQAQNIDSLFNHFVELKSPSRTIRPVISVKDADKYKCAFGLMADVKMNYEKFSESQKKIISSLSVRPVTDTSIVSPGGYFRIHYDITIHKVNNEYVDNRPQYNVNELAIAADSAYAFETGHNEGQLGFPPPPRDNAAGGDDLYDIYIVNIAGDYGFTEFESVTPNNYYITYMTIDSDFLGNYTTGIKAAKVTVAHEFHHAIQVGNYPYRSEDKWYNELTSTSMEEFVFDYVNDYYFYQSGYFEYPEKTISHHTGYDMAILNLYIKERFGFPAIKRIWENIIGNNALKAINLTFEENNASFKNELANFNSWTFFTGFRAIPGKYFKEAKYYPLLKPAMSLSYSPPGNKIVTETEPVSNNILLFVNNSLNRPDSIYAMITNADYINGYNDPYNKTDCEYTLYSTASDGARQIYPGYYVTMKSSMSGLLKDNDIVNNILVDENVNIIPAEFESPFPQPFNYLKHSTVAIPAPKGDSDESLLYIYTLNMKPVYSGSLKVYKTDKLFVRWNGLDDSKSRVPNGVYFYITQRDGSILKGKLVVQNE